MVINSCMQKNPISKLQEYAQRGQIFVPKYDDLTSKEGELGFKFIYQVYTRSKVPVNNPNSRYNNYHHNQVYMNRYSNKMYQDFGNYQYKDYTCKGYGSSKKEAKVNAASSLLAMLCGVKNPYANSNDFSKDKEVPDGTKSKNPISLIQEYCQRHHYKPTYTDTIMSGMFHCRLIVGTADSVGQGMNKRGAKVMAAQNMVNLLGKIKENDKDAKMKPLDAPSETPKSNKSKRKPRKGSGTNSTKAENKQTKEASSDTENNMNLANNATKTDDEKPLIDLSTGKHPISALHEFCQKMKLEVPVYHKKGVLMPRFNGSHLKAHNFDYRITMNIDSKEYFSHGSAQQLKQAKTAATLNMIKQLESLKHQLHIPVPPTSAPKTPGNKSGTTIDVNPKTKIAEIDPNSKMNPLALVNQLFAPEIVVEETPEKPDHQKEFKVTLKVEKESYMGIANSKKKAKLIAAAACLEKKVGHCQYNTAAMKQSWSADQFSQCELSFAKTVSNLVQQKYDFVTKDLQEHEQKRKVLAGILIRSSEKKELSGSDDLQVLVVTSGTKCIEGDSLCSTGQVLNDSHAEILARRAFKRFLLEQVKRYHKKETSILEKSTKAPFLLNVKPGLSFHLYISTSPCGDARIFTPNSPSSEETGSVQSSNKKLRGLLRTKIECGEGTIPVTNSNTVQTWDGVMAGERLKTMSCSDKLALWNVLGLQGAVLTHFLNPVYFDSVVIGGCFSLSHLTRALHTRIEGVGNLPNNLTAHLPLILPVSQQEERVPSKSSGYSVNWILGDGNVEITKTNSGRCLNENPSRLCKNSIFNKFNEVCLAVAGNLPYKDSLYLDIKNDAKNYQIAKNKVFEAFKKKGCGCWISKPIEQNMFSI